MNKRLLIVLLLCSITFAPALRSCGKITYGFPAVALEAENPVAIEKTNPVNLLINILFILALFFLVKLLSLNNKFESLVQAGLPGIYCYQLLLYFSYLVLFWCIQISDKFLIMIYVLYPFCTGLLDLDKPLLGSFSGRSPFFGDKLDIVVRLNYLASLLLWFVAAIIITRIRKLSEEKRRTKLMTTDH